MFDPSQLKKPQNLGRPTGLNLEEAAKALALIEEGFTKVSVAKAFGVSFKSLTKSIERLED